MAETILAKIDATTGRLAPGGAPRHDDLDGLAHHAPSAAGQAAGLMPQTNGDGTYTLVPTPDVDPYTAAGAILGVSRVAPAAQVDWSPNTQTGEYDPSASVTFTTPASGRVVVEVNAVWAGSTAPAPVRLQEGSAVLGECSVDPSSSGARRHLVFVLDGLTPDSSHTVSLAAPVGSGLNLRVGPIASATIIAKDAPF